MSKLYNLKILLILTAIPLMAASCNIPFSGSGDIVAGVFKTTNEGRDWVSANKTMEVTLNRRGKEETQTGEQMAENDISQLAWSKVGPKRLYAAAGRHGLFMSEDEGGTWKNIFKSAQVFAVLPDTTDSQTIYIAGSLGKQGRIWITQDFGKTWEGIYADTGENSQVKSLTSSPKTNEIIAGAENGSVIISKDKGRSWSLAYTMDNAVKQVLWHNNKWLILDRRDGLFETNNLETSLTSATEQLTDKDQNAQSDSKIARPDIFSQIAVAEQKPSLIYLATDKGIFVRATQNSPWEQLELPTKQSQSNFEITAIATNQNGDRIWASVDGTIYHTNNGGISWEVEPVATSVYIRYILLDPKQSKTAYLGLEKRQ